MHREKEMDPEDKDNILNSIARAQSRSLVARAKSMDLLSVPPLQHPNYDTYSLLVGNSEI